MIAYVRAERARDGVWDLIIDDCPYCHKRHQHGGGDGDEPFFGNRQPHCSDDAPAPHPSYDLVLHESAP